MIQEPCAMITDRLTARVLGALLLFLPFVIDTSCLIFAKPELRSQPRFVAIVILPSLPLFALGALLFRRAARMKDEES
jgi:hypothetical protein